MKMHLTDGQLRAYQDREMSDLELGRARAHLESCTRCQAQAAVILARARRVDERLAALRPASNQAPSSTSAGRAHFETGYLKSQKEHETMWNKLFSRRTRPAWVTLGIIALLAVSLAFSPVRAIANSFLGLFRVQQISVVQVNPGDLPNQLGSSSQFEYMLSKDVKVEEHGNPQKVSSAAEASAQAGIPVRLPAAAKGQETLKVQPGTKATFTVDLQHVRALLDEIGRSDIQVPSIVDGAQITLEVPTSVMAQYGACEFDLEQARKDGYDPDNQAMPRLPNCTTLVQMQSPTISAPPGLDLNQVGEAYLEFMGMTREEAAHFAQNVDWTTTFVIPIPRYGTTYKDVQVDGANATLIQQGKREYLLLWVKDGIIYALTGPGDASTALTLAESLK